MRWLIGLLLAGLLLLVHLITVAPLPPLIQAATVILYATVLPGWLLVTWLLDRPLTLDEQVETWIYSVAAGYGVATVLLLLISYLPGGVSAWLTLTVFDVAILFLASLHFFRPRHSPLAGAPRARHSPFNVSPWQWLGASVLLLLGGLFCFVNLGYAEFQGDEARAILRAAGVIQGYEDVLLLHKKGPLEILLPTLLFATTGRITEATARLPFALAGLASLFALWALGARWFGKLAGWCAALLLALDGYFIGFSRIVQYQNVVVLAVVTTLLLISRSALVDENPQDLRQTTRRLWLAALIMATGILAHYEAGLVALPALCLLWPLARRLPITSFVRAVGGALLLGALLLSLFFVPFALHPNFRYTLLYLSDDQIGHQLLYNNLQDFFLRSTLYDTTYAVLLLTVLTLIALVQLYRQSYPALWSRLFILLAVAGVGWTFVDPQWLVVGNYDLILFFFLLLFGLAWLAPKATIVERALWLWFGALFLLSLFLVSKPRTHTYIFFAPWMLIAGAMLAGGWHWLAAQRGRAQATMVGVAGATLLIVFFGFYAYLYFIYNGVEMVRLWEQYHPAIYWTAYKRPDMGSFFGFPQRSGWKVAGVLYADGILKAPFDTFAGNEWVTNWYTRGAQRCRREDAYYILGNHLDIRTTERQARFEAELQSNYQRIGEVMVQGEPRLRIYQQAAAATTQTYELAPYATRFDRELATPFLPLTPPIVAPSITHPLHIRLGEAIWLEGFDLEQDHVQPGGVLTLTLYWRTTKALDEKYSVFTQVIGAADRMIAQHDGQPSCASAPTSDWAPGDFVLDRHLLPVTADAPPGVYPLRIGMYQVKSGDRLPVFTAEGEPAGDAVELQFVTIEVKP